MKLEINSGKCKKGLMSFNFITVMMRLLFTIGVVFSVVILTNLMINTRLDVNDIQAEVLVNGLIYSPGGIGYLDPISGRVYPEIVDLEQVNSEQLDREFYYPNNNLITAKIDFYKQGIQTPQKTVYFNEEWYQNWEPLLIYQNVPGLGGVTEYNKELPIILQIDGERRLGYVNFQIIQPRRATRSNQDTGEE